MSVKKRVEWIDFLRAFAIVLVVLLHIIDYRCRISEPANFDEWFCDFATGIGHLGVPFFLFITGFLLLDRKYTKENIIRFYKKNFLGLLLTTELWFLILYLFFSLSGYMVFNINDLLDILTFTDYKGLYLYAPVTAYIQFWYLPMILRIYLFIPFIAIIISKIPIKIFYACLIIFTLYAFAADTFSHFQYAPKTDFFSRFKFYCDAFFAYVLWGYAIKKAAFDFLSKKICAVFFIISFAIMFYVIRYAHNIQYEFLPLIIAAIMFTVIIKKLRIKNIGKIIFTVSKYSFPIYLIHAEWQTFLFLFCDMPILNSISLHVIVYTFLITFTSIVIVKILNRFEFISKYLFYMR
ncbi:MAG: acyltransferase [Selenomonadaceae bacterium]|nr:acyltransferase [Selenomonadaceae bacterium]MBP3721863.1 acyltransferase [Selenomonadaceae bacterium]